MGAELFEKGNINRAWCLQQKLRLGKQGDQSPSSPGAGKSPLGSHAEPFGLRVSKIQKTPDVTLLLSRSPPSPFLSHTRENVVCLLSLNKGTQRVGEGWHATPRLWGVPIDMCVLGPLPLPQRTIPGHCRKSKEMSSLLLSPELMPKWPRLPLLISKEKGNICRPLLLCHSSNDTDAPRPALIFPFPWRSPDLISIDLSPSPALQLFPGRRAVGWQGRALRNAAISCYLSTFSPSLTGCHTAPSFPPFILKVPVGHSWHLLLTSAYWQQKGLSPIK